MLARYLCQRQLAGYTNHADPRTLVFLKHCWALGLAALLVALSAPATKPAAATGGSPSDEAAAPRRVHALIHPRQLEVAVSDGTVVYTEADYKQLVEGWDYNPAAGLLAEFDLKVFEPKRRRSRGNRAEAARDFHIRDYYVRMSAEEGKLYGCIDRWTWHLGLLIKHKPSGRFIDLHLAAWNDRGGPQLGVYITREIQDRPLLCWATRFDYNAVRDAIYKAVLQTGASPATANAVALLLVPVAFGAVVALPGPP